MVVPFKVMNRLSLFLSHGYLRWYRGCSKRMHKFGHPRAPSESPGKQPTFSILHENYCDFCHSFWSGGGRFFDSEGARGWVGNMEIFLITPGSKSADKGSSHGRYPYFKGRLWLVPFCIFIRPLWRLSGRWAGLSRRWAASRGRLPCEVESGCNRQLDLFRRFT